MKALAALLLTALLSEVVSTATSPPTPDINILSTGSPDRIKAKYGLSTSTTPPKTDTPKEHVNLHPKYNETTTSSSMLDDSQLMAHVKPFLNPKDILLEEINTLDEEVSGIKVQDEVAQTFKAEAEKFKYTTSTPRTTTTAASNAKIIDEINNTTYDSYLDTYDDDDDDEKDEDSLEDDEQVMTQCPDYCRCIGEYAAATTATCTKLVEEQSFGTGIAHLRIENAGLIRLGPHALRSRGLQQLESITITDTRIVELNQTAFDGIPYLFAVNLTRNGLQEIHPSIFQNNTQLNLLAISGNPLKHTQDLKFAKHGLFDAPSVTEFDFSYNGLTKLKRTAFVKMPSLVYVNLKGNKLKEMDPATFNTLESLLEVDLSDNMLNEVPVDLFSNKRVQSLHISGNNLTTLSTLQASKLRTLDASNNRIKIITKDDLSGMPLLDQLTLSSNGLKRIHQHAFTDLEELTFLDIRDNKLTSLTEHHLRTNARLQVLLLSDNPGLERLPVFRAAGVEYDSFSIYRFECANCGLYYLEEKTFIGMPALTRLNLSRNRLTGLTNRLLSPLSSLRVLDLSDNIINTLGSDMFEGLTNLVKLSLAGNPLVTLQVTPFLMAPSLIKLDVSRCALERVWSEARVPLTSLRFMSVRENLLRRITVEELKATPKIVGLDMAHNPFDCDDEFNEAIQWLTDHGVTPTETLRYVSNYGSDDNNQDSDGISQWTDLAKIICDGISDGPPERPVPHKGKKLKILLGGFDASDDSDSLLRNDIEGDEELLRLQIDHGVKSNEEAEKAWTTQDQEYEVFVAAENMEYHPWYTSVPWTVVVILTLMVFVLGAQIAIYSIKRRGRGPVIRPPLMLRQGLIDNKNCGLVYKPLQEEIATPHVPKRGSFYSSSTFHYDKIVPESV